ncbi:MAG: TolC family protein [Sphingomonadales bacterium]|nr:TolC family protein [Sphingomonadales bacterium]
MRILLLVAAMMVAATLPARAAVPLDIAEAVSLALAAADPSLVRYEEQAAALEARAVADSQLPDPKLRLGLSNLPLDSFRFDQQDMTMGEVMISQEFSRGDSRALMRAKRRAEADAERAERLGREIEIVRETRDAWIELRYWLIAKDKVEDSRQAVAELMEVAKAIFASGRETAQDVLRAELELSLLDDRLLDIERQTARARARLARFIGAAAARPLTGPAALPPPAAPEIILESLAHHPTVVSDSARITALDRDVDLAEEQYKPGFELEAGYGLRGGGRSDFASVGLSFDLPLFVAKRQDQQAAAARHTRQAAMLSREAKLLDLRQLLEATYADWQRDKDRVALYEKAVTARARWTSEATLTAYQSGVSDFADLVRARLADFESTLALERLRADRAQAQAMLLFLQGESHD